MQNPIEILDVLDDQQRFAAQLLRGPVLISAGAGTGKTTTIAHRIAYGIASGALNPSKILALSFTSKASGELRDRLQRLGAFGVAVRTFHSAALAQLQYFWPIHTGGRMPQLQPNKTKLLRLLLEETGLNLDDRQLRELQGEIEWRKNALVSLEKYQLLTNRPAISGLSWPQQSQLVLQYEEFKISKSYIDWEDVLLLCLGLLRSEPNALQFVHTQWRHFVVDEFQDISPLQWQLLLAWMGNSRELCVVGDPLQAIYGFAGADPKLFFEFEDKFEGAQVAELSENYRSTSGILDLARKVLPSSTLNPASAHAIEAGAGGAASLTPKYPSLAFGTPSFQVYPSTRAEAEAIAEGARGLVSSGLPANQIAVLVRLNYQLAPILASLRSLGLPVVQRTIPFFQHPEVSRAVTMIRAFAASEEDAPLFARVSKVLTQLGWTHAKPAEFDEKWERLNWFAMLADLDEATTELADFISHLEELQKAQYEPEVTAITLSTMHAAKGLEWEAVFVAQLSDGSVPYFRTFNDEAKIAEEKRLLYVAITRAKRHLHLSASREEHDSRTFKASRFLDPNWFNQIN